MKRARVSINIGAWAHWKKGTCINKALYSTGKSWAYTNNLIKILNKLKNNKILGIRLCKQPNTFMTFHITGSLGRIFFSHQKLCMCNGSKF